MAAGALLLIGPTGSGKTPLGQLLQRRGLWGRRCTHFDFGDRMRRIVEGQAPAAGLNDAETVFLRAVLESGVLLEDEHFPIAEKILRAFLIEHGVGDEGLVVLNGLPRHVGQARDIEPIVHVCAVVELACTPEGVLERIHTNAGGDRTGRSDDDLSAVRNKLEIFAARTAPMLAHYRGIGAAVETFPIAVDTTGEDVRKWLQDRPIADWPTGDRSC